MNLDQLCLPALFVVFVWAMSLRKEIGELNAQLEREREEARGCACGKYTMCLRHTWEAERAARQQHQQQQRKESPQP